MNIETLLNDHIKELDKERDSRKGSGKWKPSSFGQCYRRQWFNKIGEKATNPPDERTKRVFLAGHKFHDFIQDLIPEKQCEVLIEDDDFKGYADVVTIDKVIDIKSQHSQAFWWREVKKYGCTNCGNEWGKKRPYPEDEPINCPKCYSEAVKVIPYDTIRENFDKWLQVGFYAWKLCKKYCSLVFVSKDDLTIYQENLSLAKIKTKVQMEVFCLQGIKEMPKPSPRLYGDKKKDGVPLECTYCNWRKKCEGIEGERT